MADAPPPRITAIQVAQSNQITIELTGEFAMQMTLETSTDLQTWQTVSTKTLDSRAFNFVVPAESQELYQFYRVVTK